MKRPGNIYEHIKQITQNIRLSITYRYEISHWREKSSLEKNRLLLLGYLLFLQIKIQSTDTSVLFTLYQTYCESLFMLPLAWM